MKAITKFLPGKPGGRLAAVLLIGLFVHFLVALPPLAAEVRLIAREWPLLWGKSNLERHVVMLDGRLDSIYDYEFIARCEREIPEDAEVLVHMDSPLNILILNYYLYPRKTSFDSKNLCDRYWTVHYVIPKKTGQSSIERPGGDDRPD